jgi:predicted naringenin-chalcone synthase
MKDWVSQRPRKHGTQLAYELFLGCGHGLLCVLGSTTIGILMTLAILSIGTAVPGNRITQDEAARAASIVCCKTPEQAALLPLLYRLTGIETRHMVVPQQVIQDVLGGTTESASLFLPQNSVNLGPTTQQRMQVYAREAGPLAVDASQSALLSSGLNPRQLTHLITVSCTGFATPGVDIALIKALNLRPTIQRTHIGFMGCHGAFNGLRVASGFTGADPHARVLMCAVELCSLHYHYAWDSEKIVANALFADGAAAVVGVSESASTEKAMRVAAAGSYLFPNSETDMTWVIGDHGFEMTLSSRVPDLIGQHLRPWLQGWLEEQGVPLVNVGSWAIHPGGPRILSAIEKALGLPREATAVSREILAQFGNMSSPTVLFLLDRLRAQRAPKPWVALGFGPGLVAEAVLIA